MIYNSLKETFQDSVWIGLAIIVNRAGGIILMPLYARWFEPDEYGKMQAIIVVMSIIYALIAMDVVAGISRFYFEGKSAREKGNIIGSHLFMVAIGAIIVIPILAAGAHGIVNHIIEDPSLGITLRIAGLATCLWVVNDYLNTLLRLQRRYQSFLLLSLIQLILLVSTNIILIKEFDMGLDGVFVAMMGSYGIIFVGHFVLKTINVPLSVSANAIKASMRYCYPLIIVSLLEWLRMQFYQLYIVHQFGNTQLGYIAVATRIVQMYVMCDYAFNMSWTRKSMEQLSHPRANELYQYFYKYSLIIFTGVFGILVLFSKEIIFLIATPDYIPASHYIVPIITISFGEVLAGFYCMGLLIAKKTLFYMFANLLSAIIGIPLIILMSSRFGIYGTLTAAAAYSILVAFVSLVFANRYYRIGFMLKPLFPIGLFCVGAGAYNSFLAVQNISVVESLTKGVFCLSLIILLYKYALSPKERKVIMQFIASNYYRIRGSLPA